MHTLSVDSDGTHLALRSDHRYHHRADHRHVIAGVLVGHRIPGAQR